VTGIRRYPVVKCLIFALPAQSLPRRRDGHVHLWVIVMQQGVAFAAFAGIPAAVRLEGQK